VQVVDQCGRDRRLLPGCGDGDVVGGGVGGDGGDVDRADVLGLPVEHCDDAFQLADLDPRQAQGGVRLHGAGAALRAGEPLGVGLGLVEHLGDLVHVLQLAVLAPAVEEGGGQVHGEAP
jgi:hypothetical protein